MVRHLEVEDGLERDPSDARHIGHPRNAVNHGAEDDRRDQHADRLDERVTQRLHLRAKTWPEHPQQDSDRHREQHLHP